MAAAVVNLTGTARSAPALRRYRLPLPAQERPRAGEQARPQEEPAWRGLEFAVVEIYVAQESAPAVVGMVSRREVGNCILALLPLMQGGGEPGIMRSWLELASLEPDAGKRSELGVLTLTLAELTEHWAAWQEALKGWNMEESQTALRWVTEGLTEGRKEGLKEGELGALREAVRDLLADRFPSVPPEVLDRVKGCQDATRLKAALRQVARISRAEDLLL